MGKKSKNCGDGQIFSHYERAEAKRANRSGLQAVQVGTDFFDEPDTCGLCLNPAQTPLVCTEGHIFCKSCIYENLLFQKDEHKHAMKEYELQEKKDALSSEMKRKEEEEASIMEFNKAQSTSFIPSGTTEDLKDGPRKISGYKIAQTNEGKDIYVVDKEALHAQIADPTSMPENSKPMSAFWLPQIAPNAGPTKLRKPKEKAETICPSSKTKHQLKLKHLRPVNFTLIHENQKKANEHIKYMCQSCLSPFSKLSSICIVRTCGHVFCKNCTDSLVLKEKSCLNCDVPCPTSEVVQLSTGSAGGKENMIIKKVHNPLLNAV